MRVHALGVEQLGHTREKASVNSVPKQHHSEKKRKEKGASPHLMQQSVLPAPHWEMEPSSQDMKPAHFTEHSLPAEVPQVIVSCCHPSTKRTRGTTRESTGSSKQPASCSTNLARQDISAVHGAVIAIRAIHGAATSAGQGCVRYMPTGALRHIHPPTSAGRSRSRGSTRCNRCRGDTSASGPSNSASQCS